MLFLAAAASLLALMLRPLLRVRSCCSDKRSAWDCQPFSTHVGGRIVTGKQAQAARETDLATTCGS